MDWGVSFEEPIKESKEKPVKNWEEISKNFASRLQKIENELNVNGTRAKASNGNIEPEIVLPIPPPPPPPDAPAPVHPIQETIPQEKLPEQTLEPPAPPPIKPTPERSYRADTNQPHPRQDRGGRVNGSRGRVNGTKQGRINGTGRGKVNGIKKQALPEEEDEAEPSRMRMKVGGILPLWQLLSLLVVAILMLSTVAILLSQSPAETGIKIDGAFDDWGSVPSYAFSQAIAGWIAGVDEGKMSFVQDLNTESKLSVYLKTQNSMFAGNNVSTVYVFIDSDADPGTGYKASRNLGADLMVTISGWNGSIMERSLMRFASTQDQEDWNSWEASSSFPCMKEMNEIELSVNVPLTAPLVQIATQMGDSETIGPMMSIDGTIVVRETSLLNGIVTTDYTPSLFRIKAMVMGASEESLAFQPVMVNDTGFETVLTNMTLSSTEWTTQNYDYDLSLEPKGRAFHFTISGSSAGFDGKIDLAGATSCGYFMSAPTSLTIDGLFVDWKAIKKNDTDASVIGNPSIDIREYGVAAQNNSLFVYVGTAGDALKGSDIPEHKKKPSHDSGGGGSVVRLKKTGEDLLQVYIDINPSSGIGKYIAGETSYIEADYLIEVYGRDGNATSEYVKRWSVVDGKWNDIGTTEKVAVGQKGIEFSVNKSPLGDLSACEMMIFTTDWKADSDNCRVNASLIDPWAVRGTPTTADTYRSNDGTAWTNAGSISLLAGERIVSMAHSIDRTYVFAVTNTGRVYDWRVNVDTSWGPEVTGPCNSTNVVGIAPNSTTGEGRCMILASNGWTWTTTTLGGARNWINGTRIIQGFTDFKDISYNATGGRYWAIRSTSNTNIFYSSGGAWTQISKKTGAGANQVHIYHIGSAAGTASEQIFILRQDGTMRYSADGGANWANRGNLPAPGNSGLPAYSVYVAIDRDANNNFWAITNTSYCYKSTDTGITWTNTGNFGVKDVVSLACPAAYIPEFDSVTIPVIAIITLVIIFSSRGGRRKRSGIPRP